MSQRRREPWDHGCTRPPPHPLAEAAIPPPRSAAPPPSAPPPAPTPAQAVAVDRLARFVVRFGLTVPAILALEGMRPLSFAGSQLMHVLTPSLGVFLSPADWEALALLLEDRQGLEVVLRRIEEVDAWRQAHGELPPPIPPPSADAP